MRLNKSFKRILWIVFAIFLLWVVFKLLQNWTGTTRPNEDRRTEDQVTVSIGKPTTDAGDDSFFIPKYWKYHNGDDSLWSTLTFDDSDWDTINPKMFIDSIPKDFFTGSCWFRAKILIDSSKANKILGIDFSHNGASEIYYDGKLIQRYGKVSGDKKAEDQYMPRFPLLFASGNTGQHLFAIRYSNHKFLKYHSNDYEFGGYAGISMEFIDDPNDSIDRIEILKYINLGISILLGFFLSLSIAHFLLFLFYRQKKHNLYYSIFTFSFALLFLDAHFQVNATNPDILFYVSFCTDYLIVILVLSLIKFLYLLFTPKGAKAIFIIGCILGLISILTEYYWQFLNVIVFPILFLLGFVEYTRSIIVGFRRKGPGAKIIGTSSLIFIGILMIFALYFLFIDSFNTGQTFVGLLVGFLVLLFISTLFSIIGVPLSMSIYLAYDFALTNKNLRKKLIEVEDLSARTIAQEKEKQEILSRQKEVLEIQVAERTKEITEQKKVIENKNKDITDSINYAKRIQDAILPSEIQIKKMFPESFILFKPKDIVSGDFYFYSPLERGKGCVIAAVDCTGHGVPGAFMSMMGHNHLDEIVNERKITGTAEILDELHKRVLYTLNRDITKRDSKDGMDIAIVSIKPQIPSQKSQENTNTKENLNFGASDLGLGAWDLEFSGAVRPLFYFDKDGFHEVKGDRWSVGGVKEIDGQPFSSATIQLEHPVTFYLFSDGFADQFGGKEEKKFMTKRFRELLVSIQEQNMDEQKTFLENFFEEWKKDKEQTDDVLVMGVRV